MYFHLQTRCEKQYEDGADQTYKYVDRQNAQACNRYFN